MEFVKTNVLGAENLIQVYLDTGETWWLSTDRPPRRSISMAPPSFVQTLFIAANNIKGVVTFASPWFATAM